MTKKATEADLGQRPYLISGGEEKSHADSDRLAVVAG